MKRHSLCLFGGIMASTKPNKIAIAETIEKLISPTVAELGYILWDVAYLREPDGFNLLITIDNENGITLEDCEKVTRAINPLLDEADPIEDSYSLEVSSPGLERVLKRPLHFDTMVGQKVKVNLFARANEDFPSIIGKKSFEAILGERTATTLTLTVDGASICLPLESISKVKTIFEL